MTSTLGILPVRLRTWLSRQQSITLRTLGGILLLVIAWIDYITGTEMSFWIFYVTPVALLTWFDSGRAGITMSILGAATWYLVDLWGGHQYSHPLVAVWNVAVRLGFFVVICLSVYKIRVSLNELVRLIRIDPLTGALNPRGFEEISNKELERARRYGYSLTLAYLDVDNFKIVNDQYGHSVGDAVLKVTSVTIQSDIRDSDVLARLGGDEFAILLPETRSKMGKVVISRIEEKLLNSMREHGWQVTFSIGAVTFASMPSSVDEMIRIADNLMYSAKEQGRNRITFGVYGADGVQVQEATMYCAGEREN